MLWFEGPHKWAWIAYMVILTIIGEIVLFKGIKMINRYFDEEEKKEQEIDTNTDIRE